MQPFQSSAYMCSAFPSCARFERQRLCRPLSRIAANKGNSAPIRATATATTTSSSTSVNAIRLRTGGLSRCDEGCMRVETNGEGDGYGWALADPFRGATRRAEVRPERMIRRADREELSLMLGHQILLLA